MGCALIDLCAMGIGLAQGITIPIKRVSTKGE